MKFSHYTAAVVVLFVCSLFAAADGQTKSQIESAGYKTDVMMMPYYTGTIIPTPQQAKYGKTFLSLDRTGIVLADDIMSTDSRLSYLLDRITRYGGNYGFVSPSGVQGKTCLIYVGNTKEASDLIPPEKPQEYLMLMVVPTVSCTNPGKLFSLFHQ